MAKNTDREGPATTLHLPWPSKWLSPNAKNGSKRARMAYYNAKKAARKQAWALAMEAGLSWGNHKNGAELRFTFHPPNRIRRDVQNLPHQCKPLIDGIADAMGCDDSLFRVYFPPEFADVVKGGSVVLEIGERT